MSIGLYVKAANDLQGNPEQRAAYDSEDNCVILAGPGSGKTKTLTLKMAKLLAEDVRPPQRLACITYSNACVVELRARLKALEIEDGDRLSLSSVHSFCLSELIIPFAQLAGLISEPIAVATPAQCAELHRQAQIKVLGEPMRSFFRTSCEKLRRTILDRTSSEWYNWDGRQAAVVDAYEAALLKKGLIDFDGMVLMGVRLVEEYEWVRLAIKAKFPVIVIDEYQDLGLPLHRMVLALMNKAKVRIIAVGDPDQSIYGFTGANPKLLSSLADLPNVESIRLRLNYRCAENIITASKTLLVNPVDFKSHDNRKGIIQIHQSGQDVNGQTDYCLKTLVPELLKQNLDWRPGDIAILYQSKTEGSAIAATADALGLKYFRADNGSPIKRSRLIDWLIDAARWCSGGWEDGSVSLSHLLKSWRQMRCSLITEGCALAERSQLIRVLFDLREGSMPLHTWLESMSDAIINNMLDDEPAMADEHDNFSDLLSGSTANGPLAHFTVEIFGNQGRDPERLNLITLHSSKGLEFKAIVMINLEKDSFPSSMIRTNDEYEESARLFYVGVTRAKSQVHLVYNEHESPFVEKIRKTL